MRLLSNGLCHAVRSPNLPSKQQSCHNNVKNVRKVYNIKIFLIPGLIIDLASATVSVGRIRGIPDPMAGDEKAYFITYEFLSHQKPVNLVMYPSYYSS